VNAGTPIDFPRVRESLLSWLQSNDFGHGSYRKFPGVRGWRASYILEGTLTVGMDGGDVREYQPGEVITESRDVTHWGEIGAQARW